MVCSAPVRVVLCCLILVPAARAHAQAPDAVMADPPQLDLRRLCAVGVQAEVRHCPACTPRAPETLCALYRAGFSPFTVEQIESSGDFRRVSGYILSGIAGLCAIGATVVFIAAYGVEEPGMGSTILAGVGGTGLTLGAIGFGIAGPLLVRSGNKRLEAADMLRAFPPAPARAATPMLRISGAF